MKRAFEKVEAASGRFVKGASGRRPLLLWPSASAVFVILLLLCGSARAQQVQAALSQDVTAVGQPVQLDVSVVGGRGAVVPPELKVDGLEARFSGKSEQMQVQMTNGRFSSTVTATYTYLIIPLRTGTFIIPAIPVSVGGKTFKTAPLTLKVGGSSGGVPVLPAVPVQPGQQNMPPSGVPQIQTVPPSGSRQQPQGGEEKIAFGDLLVPKETAFAGEVIPVEIRFYFDAKYQVRLQDRPGFSGDGFMVMSFSKPTERQQEINGRVYNVVSFQTALTPAKAGMLEIPAATIETQIQVPGQSRGMDDFFGGLFGHMGETRQVTVTTSPVKLNVKPLPKDGRPDEFSGAIGQFSMQATASPKKAGAGDPITMKVVVSGRGNFDGMGAPTLIDTDGWRTYPPSEKFAPSPSDPIGFNGEKTFEYMILAREDRSATPVAEFSFFDPAVEKYVTLKSPPVAVDVRGGVIPASPGTTAVAAATPAPSLQPQSSAATPAPAESDDVLVSNFQPGTFAPLFVHRNFQIANGAAAALWCAALLFAVGKMASTSSSAKKSAARRESRKILKKLEDSDCEPVQFYDGAAEFVRSRLAGGDYFGHTHDLLEASTLPPATKEAVRGLLDQHDTLKYSTFGAGSLGAEERTRVIELLKTFDNELK